jgi:hypothetical protein
MAARRRGTIVELALRKKNPNRKQILAQYQKPGLRHMKSK